MRTRFEREIEKLKEDMERVKLDSSKAAQTQIAELGEDQDVGIEDKGDGRDSWRGDGQDEG